MNHEAIYNTHATVVSIDDTKGAMDVNGNTVSLNQSKIDTETTRLANEATANQYKLDRAAAYASIGDQLDMQYHDAVDETTTWKDHIAAIKAQYPKS
jgi:hypothetical protein